MGIHYNIPNISHSCSEDSALAKSILSSKMAIFQGQALFLVLLTA